MPSSCLTDFSDPARRIIVALDVADERRLLELVRALRGHVGLAKVGKELFCSLGPRAVELVRSEGLDVFLDLKFHDIPNTVAGAVRAAGRMDVSMLTVHTSGGANMLKAALDAAHDSPAAPMVIGVTVLTSLNDSDLNRLGYRNSTSQMVLNLAEVGLQTGLDGLVASAQELVSLRNRFGNQPYIVTPGIRPQGVSADDQQRIATPSQAVSDGADFLVVGRPITQASDPVEAANAICDSLVQEAE